MINGIAFAKLSVLAATLPSYATAKADLMPLVAAALLLDAVIVSLWYMFGTIINNPGVKAGARGEFYQLIGTALLIAIVLGFLAIFSQFFYSSLNSTALMSSTTLNAMCSNIMGSTGLDMLKSGGLLGYICNNYIANSGRLDALTYQLGYPLAASAVIIANLTNQTAFNLNNLYLEDAYLGFLSTLSPYFGICISGEINVPWCLIPLPEPPPAFDLGITATPYAGYGLIYQGFRSLGTLMTSAYESFILQMTFVTMFLFIWPVLLFVGIVLRATFFTRKIGGLFIAVAIGAIFFFPVIYSIQYLVLGRGLGNVPGFGNTLSVNPNSIASIYGFNGITSNTLTSIPGYTPNFYVEPQFNNIAASTGCWVDNGNPSAASGVLVNAEVSDIAALWIPFFSLASLISSIYGSFVGGYPSLPSIVQYQCSAQQAESVLFAYLNAYGIFGITAYLLPVLDILVTMSAIIGLSGLLGGDTQLAGLSRLI